MKVRHRKHVGYYSWRQRTQGYVDRMRRHHIIVIAMHSKCGRAGVDMGGA